MVHQGVHLPACPHRPARLVQVQAAGDGAAPLQQSGGHRPHEEGVGRVLTHQLDLVVFIQEQVAVHRLQHGLKVLLRTLSRHVYPHVGGHPEQGVVDVLDGCLGRPAGELAPQAADAAQQVLQAPLAGPDEQGVVPGLLRGVPLRQRLAVGVSAGGYPHGGRAGGLGHSGGGPRPACQCPHQDGGGHVAQRGHRVIAHLSQAAARHLRPGVREPRADLGRAVLRCAGGQPLGGEGLPHPAAELVQPCPQPVQSGGRGPSYGVADVLDVLRLHGPPALIQRLLQAVQVGLGGLFPLPGQQVVVDIYLVIGHEVVQGPAHHMAVGQGDLVVVVPGIGDDVAYRLGARPPAEQGNHPFRLLDGGIFDGRPLICVLPEVWPLSQGGVVDPLGAVQLTAELGTLLVEPGDFRVQAGELAPLLVHAVCHR